MLRHSRYVPRGLALLLLVAPACKGEDPCLDCAPRPDLALADLGLPDAGRPDAGPPDAGRSDGGLADAGLPDAGRSDGGLPDAGLPDAAIPDAGLPDASGADAAVRDAASPDAGSVCPSYATGVTAGRTPDGILTEASGIAASRRNPGTLWTHNDSGAGPRIFALSSTGATQALYDLDGAGADDWEDIAVGPGPVAGKSYVYVGDIGDNSTARANIDLYRVAEPDVKTGSPTTAMRLSGVEHFKLRYPDGAHNAETLLVDPPTGDVYIVVKSGDGVSPVFRAAAPLSAAATITLQKVATLRFGTAPLTGNKTTTGGDISPGGDAIAIRSYDSAYLFRRASGTTVADALATPPCRLPLQLELQGEALGFAADSSGYYTVSEGNKAPIYFYARR